MGYQNIKVTFSCQILCILRDNIYFLNPKVTFKTDLQHCALCRCDCNFCICYLGNRWMRGSFYEYSVVRLIDPSNLSILCPNEIMASKQLKGMGIGHLYYGPIPVTRIVLNSSKILQQ